MGILSGEYGAVVDNNAAAYASMVQDQAFRARLWDVLKKYPGEVASSIWETVKYPGQLAKGEKSFSYDEAIPQAFNAAGMAITGSMPMAPRGALGSGGGKPVQPSDMFDMSRLSDVPQVPQFDLPRYTPPRGVPQRVADVTTNPEVRSQMLEVIRQGRDMGGANWYNAEPLREVFVRELGAEGGNKAFRSYMDLVAATSPRSDVGTNVRNASYYYGRLMRGEGMPEVGSRNPQPYGHMAQRLHQMNAERVAGAGWNPLNNPKPASFVENLVGNQQPATIDTHAFRLPGLLAKDERFLETAYQANKDAPKQNIQKMVQGGELSLEDAAKRPAYWQAQPKANEYAAMEQYYQSLGRELGLTPAQTQASAWVGGGKITGLASDETKPFLGFFQDRVRMTAEALKMDPNDVLKKFVKGEMPLLGVSGAAAGALLPYAQELLSQKPERKSEM